MNDAMLSTDTRELALQAAAKVADEYARQSGIQLNEFVLTEALGHAGLLDALRSPVERREGEETWADLTDLHDYARSRRFVYEWGDRAVLSFGAMKLAEEVGEAIRPIAEVLHQEGDPHAARAEFEAEAGDVLFLLALVANALGVDLTRSARGVIDKLTERYPDDHVQPRRSTPAYDLASPPAPVEDEHPRSFVTDEVREQAGAPAPAQEPEPSAPRVAQGAEEPPPCRICKQPAPDATLCDDCAEDPTLWDRRSRTVPQGLPRAEEDVRHRQVRDEITQVAFTAYSIGAKSNEPEDVVLSLRRMAEECTRRILARPVAGSEQREPEERCESGCAAPVVAHDRDGVPLCQGCADALIAAEIDRLQRAALRGEREE